MTTMRVTITDTHGDEHTLDLPARWVVCGDCDGAGRVLGATIRAHAYTPEDMAADPAFAAEYARGAAGIYGVTCPTCRGRTTVLAPDAARCDRADLGAYRRHVARVAVERAEAATWARLENGWVD